MSALTDWSGGACDCHMHVYERRLSARADGDLQAAARTRRGVPRSAAGARARRVVVVQPTGYGFDNRCTLAAIAATRRAVRAASRSSRPDIAGGRTRSACTTPAFAACAT